MEIMIATTTCRISTPGFFLSGSSRPQGTTTRGMASPLAPQHAHPQVGCAQSPLAGLGRGRFYGGAIVNDPSFDLEPWGVAV